MNMRELIPWGGSSVPVGRGHTPMGRASEFDPFWTLHREVDRLFDEAFRGFFRGSDVAPFSFDRTWPNIEMAETDKEVRITAELPGLDEKDVNVELSNGVLMIAGERKSESENGDRRFSERYYGRFQRRIPLNCEVEEDKVAASFRNGVLTVTLPKAANAQNHTNRIPIN